MVKTVYWHGVRKWRVLAKHVTYDNVYWRCTTASKVALYINKSQGMTLSAGANITGLNHTLQQLILQAWKSQGKYPKQRILIVYTNYWLQKNTKTLIYHVYNTHKQRILYWCSLTSKVRGWLVSAWVALN